MPTANKTGAVAWRGPRQQQGIAAVFAAVSLITLLSAVGLAIDVGRLYFAKRDLQRLSDLAAIDGARVKSQCLGAAGFDDVVAEVSASLARNGLPQGATTQVLLGKRESGDDGLQRFAPRTAEEPSDSVQVTLTRASPSRILPLFGGENSRNIVTRAAAKSSSSVTIPAPSVGLLSPDPTFYNALFGGLLNSNISLTGGQLRASLDATVDGQTLLDAEITAGLPALPDVNVPQPVQGLLNAILASLDSTGDQAAFTAVSIFAQTLLTGRGVVDVVPADLLGLSPGQTYDDVTIPVGGLLTNIAMTVANGEPIEIDLPLPEPLGDGVRITVQPGRPGSAATFTPGLQLNNSESTDAAFAAASLVRIEVELLNPVTGEPFKLPLYTSIQPARASFVKLSCARLGQDGHQVDVEAQGSTAIFAIGQIDEVFTGSGLDGLPSLFGLPPQPLFPLTILGQTVEVSAQLDPVTIGDNSPQQFCFNGPPFNRALQCDGSPATLNGVSSDAIVQSVADALSGIRLQVTLPSGLPGVLTGPVQTLANEALDQLSAQLAPVLSLLSQLVVPQLQQVGLTAGLEEVRVAGVTVVQPKVYAQ